MGAALPEAFEVARSLSHGHVGAVLGMMRQFELERLLGPGKERPCVLAMVAARILEPGSELATVRALNAATAHSSLGECLGVGDIEEDDLYRAMDGLLPRQEKIEQALARPHLGDGTLVLYDVTSTYFEGL